LSDIKKYCEIWDKLETQQQCLHDIKDKVDNNTQMLESMVAGNAHKKDNNQGNFF